MSDAAADHQDAAPADVAAFVPLRRGDLRRGTVLERPVLDDRGVLLLAAGQTVTDTFHAKLVDRGLDSVRVHPAELPRLLAGVPQGEAADAPPSRAGVVAAAANPLSDALDRLAADGKGLALPPQEDAFRGELAPAAGRYDGARRDAAVSRMTAAVSDVGAIQRELAGGGGFDLAGLRAVAGGALDDLAADRDLFASLGLNPHGSGYPTRHGVHAAMLASAVGATLGLDRKTLVELSVGVLVHDAGMLRLDPATYETPGPLSRAAFLEVTKHPVLVFDSLRSLEGVPARSAFIAYQMHERCDGSGYPRRRTGRQLHELAKIAAVADTFTALCAPRPYRPGMAPHHAVARTLREAAAGKLDAAAAKALLQTVSLFPLGSRVALDDGRRGRTLRATADPARPVVELDPPGGCAGRGVPGELVDLSVRADRRVVGVSAEAAPLAGEDDAGETRRAAA